MAIYYLLDDNNDVVVLILEGDDKAIYIEDGIEFTLDDEPVNERVKLMIEYVDSIDFVDEPVNEHAKLTIVNVDAIDFVDEPVNEHVKLTIEDVNTVDFIDESVEYCTIDVKPCDVTYDSNGNIIKVTVCDYEVDDDDFDEAGEDDDGNEVKLELHKVVRETGDVIDVKLYVEPKYKPELEIEDIDVTIETYQYDDDNKHAITFIANSGTLTLYRRNYIMPPYDIIDFDSDDDQKLILVDDYEATTTNDEVVEHVTDITNAVVEYTPSTMSVNDNVIDDDDVCVQM